MLGRWIKENQQDQGQAFRGNGKMTEEQAKIKKLEARVKELEMEKDILKKATFFFAKGNFMYFQLQLASKGIYEE